MANRSSNSSKKSTGSKSAASSKANSTQSASTRAPRKKIGLPDVVTGEVTSAASLGGRQLTDFLNFVRQQGVVGLAVGLAIGTAAGAAVKQIVDGFINPIVGFLIGGIDLTKVTWVVVKAGTDGKGGLVISWGAILSALITLIATALVVYIIVHGAKLDKLDKPKA